MIRRDLRPRPLTALLCLAALACSAVFAHADRATIRVRSLPVGAKVFVNGYYKGKTPVSATIANAGTRAKSYKITLIKPGYEKWQGSVSVKAGETKTVTGTLHKGDTAAAVTGHLKGKVICIDPGHPSEVSEGSTGAAGTAEKHVNWVVAQKLKALLLAEGAKVVLTKTSENEKVSNRERAEIANRAKAAIILRLHSDSGPVDGCATYYPDKPGEKDGVKGPSEEIIRRSKAAAKAFHPAFAAILEGHITDRGIHGDSATLVGSQQGALTGCIFSKVPVLTIEMCVLSSRHDEAFIKTDAGQARMAKALAAGVKAALGG
jgi:N-acetylmuramoyl-L-alanine amidase